MKTKHKLSILFILLSVVISACQAPQVSPNADALPTLPQNPFTVQATEETDQVEISQPPLPPGGFGFSVEPLNYDFRFDQLVYEGSPIELSFAPEFYGENGSIGIMFFVDGVPQPHKVIKSTQSLPGKEDPNQEKYVSVHKMNNHEKIEITLQFTPLTGKKGEKLSFNMVQMPMPEFLPETESGYFSVFQDGHPHDYGTILFEADAPTQVESRRVEPIFEPIPDSMKLITEDNPTGRIKQPYYRLNDGTSEYTSKVYLKDGKAQLRVIIGGGVESDYRLTLFVNHQPIQVDGEYSFLIRSKYDYLSIWEFELSLPDLPHLNSFYATILPVGDGYILNPEGGEKTKSILLINPDAK